MNPESAARAISIHHGDRFATDLSPMIEKLVSKQSRNSRKNFLSDISDDDKAKRYQRFAEIAFHEKLLNCHPDVQCPEHPADFFLPKENCFIEVVTPSIGELTSLAEYTSEPSTKLRGVPVDDIILKHWDVLERKMSSAKCRFQKNQICTGAKFIVAVCPILLANNPFSALGHNDYGYPYIAKALFPIGGNYFWVEPKSGQEGSGIARQDTVAALRGGERQKNLFLDQSNMHISAAIAFAPDESWFETWAHITVHNPFAANPIPIKFVGGALAEYEASIEGRDFTLRQA